MSDPTFDRLNEIADALEPFVGSWQAAWRNVGRGADTATEMKELDRTTDALNAAIEPYVEEVARVTNNSVSTLRQVYAPRSAEDRRWHAWFSGSSSPAQFLRNVAKHRSFNETHWAAQERKTQRTPRP